MKNGDVYWMTFVVIAATLFLLYTIAAVA